MFLSHDSLWGVVLALLLDGLIGDPQIIWRHFPHPVVLMGRFIAAAETRLNLLDRSFAQRRTAGGLALILFISIGAGAGLALEAMCSQFAFGPFVIALSASLLFAQRSLYEHILQVRRAFREAGLEAARVAVARVVGRDPEFLDEAGVCRAAIESCAENFSDGVVAPVFWFALLGLPGLIIYKFVNTADSMIGHRTPRYEAFGWASARLDDVLNLLPARLSGLLLSCMAPVVGGRVHRALSVMWRDARHHRSPNAGWPESAAAGALDVTLAGPRHYAGQKAEEPFLNPEGSAAKPDDISRMLRLFLSACGFEALIYAVLALWI